MKQKLLATLLALLAIATTAAAATDYDLWVGGVRVTSANALNIKGDAIKKGTVRYFESTKVLYLTDVE